MVDRYLKAMLVSFIVVFTSLSGCFGSDDGPSDNDHKVDDDVTTPETTKQLDNEALSSMTSISEDGSEMVFKGFDLPDIEEEDVLSLGISENTPYGLLRKVTGIRTEGDQTTLTTKQATIEDAVEEGRIEYRENITIPEKLTYSVDGVSLWTEPTRSGGDGIIFQNVELYKGDPGSIILNGLLDMDFDLIFILDLEDFSITECSFGARTTFTGELNITSDGDMEFDTELEVSRIEFTPFIIPMGPIELVLVPVLSLVIGSKGTVSSGLCITSRQDTILDVSVEHPCWQPTKDFTSNFEYSTPTLSNGTSVNCYAGPEMALLLWGVAGPYITAHGYMKVESDREGIWWLYGGLSFGMGFRIEVLGTTIKEWEKTDIIDFRRLIATSMDDLAGEWIVEKLDYAVQLSGPILSCSSRDELVLVYTSIDPETGYFPIRMALLKEGIWSFEELLFSNEYDMMDIALSDNGDVNLAYFEGGSKQYIEVVKWDGSTTSSFRFNDPDMKGMHVSDLEMVLDDQGRPNIYYVLTETTGSYGFFEFSPSILKRAVLDGFYFTNTTLLENRSITGLDLEMSNDDTVHMSYMNTRIEIYHQYLIYSELRNGSWSNTTVFHDDAIFNNPSHTSLELDGDGNPSIMFDDNNGSVKYYRFRNSVWKREETPQIGGSYHGIFSHHILGGADPVCSYIGSSGDQSHVFHFSLLGLEGWNSVSVLEWKSWRFPGGTDIEESGNRVYIAFNDGLYLRVASKEISSTVP